MIRNWNCWWSPNGTCNTTFDFIHSVRKRKKNQKNPKIKKKKKKKVFMRYQLATTIHEYMNQKAWCIDVRALIPRWLAEVFLKSVRDNISLWHR